ncbi:hypothetical protein Cgig2_016805 [Carnegiea gigantea]|uniref:Uncharacterized protein n=1 Tax=Carnegiea gigantea TaxID=171969 RepID=A0A9Q1GZG7_9CARY|nr:hypothetical protein Cgig2_016805 [Carnegiea gigantea]
MAGIELQNTVKEALNALFNHLDDAFRIQADRWLQEFQRTIDASAAFLTVALAGSKRKDRKAVPFSAFLVVKLSHCTKYSLTIFFCNHFLSMKLEAVNSETIPTITGFHSQDGIFVIRMTIKLSWISTFRWSNFQVDTLLGDGYSCDVSVQIPLIQAIVPQVMSLRPSIMIPQRSEDNKRKNKDLQDLAAREFATLGPPQSEGLHTQLGSLGPLQSKGLHKQSGRSVDRTI